MKTILLTDELIANIANKHGRCGEDWYITSDEGDLYLHIKDKNLFLHPILICEPIMRHLGYLTPSNPLPQEEPQDEERVTIDDMKRTICAYLNTHDAAERKRMFNLCHFPATTVDELHVMDAQRMYNTIKLKTHGKQ